MNQKKKIRKNKINNSIFFLLFFFLNRIDLEELKRLKEKIVELTSKLRDMEVS
jgi:hypothetical protein